MKSLPEVFRDTAQWLQKPTVNLGELDVKPLATAIVERAVFDTLAVTNSMTRSYVRGEITQALTQLPLVACTPLFSAIETISDRVTGVTYDPGLDTSIVDG